MHPRSLCHQRLLQTPRFERGRDDIYKGWVVEDGWCGYVEFGWDVEFDWSVSFSYFVVLLLLLFFVSCVSCSLSCFLPLLSSFLFSGASPWLGLVGCYQAVTPCHVMGMILLWCWKKDGQGHSAWRAYSVPRPLLRPRFHSGSWPWSWPWPLDPLRWRVERLISNLWGIGCLFQFSLV